MNTINGLRAKITRSGQVTLPKRIRERLGVREGDQVQFEETDRGIVLHPLRTVVVPAEQAWFWEERWQEGEREAEEDIRAGRVHEIDDPADLLKPIEELRRIGTVEHKRMLKERGRPRA